MEKDRTKKITMIVLIVAVIGLTVAFAALSQTLTINGSANVDAATWNIHFDNLSDAKISGEAKENSKPSINEDDKVRIDGINVTLNNPKDKVVYNVDLVNEGSIDAEISNIVVPTLTEEQEKYLEFKVAYTNTDKELSIGDLLNKGETKHLTITIRYKDEIDPSELPKDKQTISLSYELTFVQTDKESGTSTPSAPEEPEQSDLFTWDGPTVVTGLTEKGIEQVKANNGHLVIPEGVEEIAGTTIQEFSSTGYLTTGFSPFAIGKINMSESDASDKLNENSIIKSVTFPSTLKKIGDLAFAYCSNLTDLDLPEGLEEIGDGAFMNSENLTGNLLIPDGVTTIGNYAFGETSITSLIFGNNVKIIGDYAFIGIEQITGKLYLPDSVLTIGIEAFSKTNITSVSISSSTSYNNDSFPSTVTISVRD